MSRSDPTPLCFLLLAVFAGLLAVTPGNALNAPTAAVTEPLPPAGEPVAEPAIEAAYQFALAKMLAEEGAHDQALEAYQRSIALDGSALYARLELAQFYLMLAQTSRNRPEWSSHLEAAAEQVEAARQLAPESSDTLRAYSQVELQLAERDPAAAGRAAEALETLRQRGEADLQVLTSLGQLYLWQRRGKEAADVLQEAASSLPGHRTLNKMLLQALLQAEELKRAESVLRQLIEVEPESLESQLQLAEVLSRLGQHAEAIEALRQAPAELREQPELRQALAGELHLAGQDQAALVEVDTLLAENPERDSLRRLRVQVLSSLLRYDEAIVELHEIARRSTNEAGPGLDVALVLSRLLERVGRSPEAIDQLRKALARAGEQDSLRVRLALVGALERAGQLDAAAALVQEVMPEAALATLPMLARTSSDLLARASRSEEAVTVLEAAAARLASVGEAKAAERLRLARWAVVAEQERWQELAEGIQPMLKIDDPELRLGARLLRAEALAELGRLDDALGTLREEGLETGFARQLEAKRAELLLRFGRAEQGRAAVDALIAEGGVEALAAGAQIYQRAELYEDMLALATRTRDLEPDSVRSLFLHGSACERLGRLDCAAEAFARLLSFEPEYAPALNYLGYLWAERGEKLETARQMIEKAVSLEPDNGAYVDSLGWVYFQLRRYPEARRHLEWASRLLPDDATVWEHLGDLYVTLREVEPARTAYRRALDLGADDPERTRAKLEALATAGP